MFVGLEIGLRRLDRQRLPGLSCHSCCCFPGGRMGTERECETDDGSELEQCRGQERDQQQSPGLTFSSSASNTAARVAKFSASRATGF